MNKFQLISVLLMLNLVLSLIVLFCLIQARKSRNFLTNQIERASEILVNDISSSIKRRIVRALSENEFAAKTIGAKELIDEIEEQIEKASQTFSL